MACVPRRLAYILVWLVATGATMAASWLALRSVLDVATPHRPTPLSAADLRRSPSPTGSTTAPGRPTTPTTRASTPDLVPPPNPTSSKPSRTDTGWVMVADGHGGSAFQRTFHLGGGDLTVLADQREARVLSSRPKPGWTVFTSRYDYRTILVTFLSGQKISRVLVSWRNGPYAEVTETVS